MFRRLFGIKKDTKSISRTQTLGLTQELYTKLLIDLDKLFVANCNDMIVISSPFPMDKCTESIHQSLNMYNLSYITPFITSFLFYDKSTISFKMQFVTTINWETLTQLMNKMSIIIIDVSSSQYIAIPTNISDLQPSNNILNTNLLSRIHCWKILWSTNSSEVSVPFIDIMNDICTEVEHSYCCIFFSVNTTYGPSTRRAPSLNDSITAIRTSTSALERREILLENKINKELENAKTKAKTRDKEGAIRHLVRKRNLERQLQSIQEKKLNLETQIMTLEDCHIHPSTMHLTQSMRTQRHQRTSVGDELMEDIDEAMDQVVEMNESMAVPLVSVMDDDELEQELAELDDLEADVLLEVPTAPTQDIVEMTEEDRELVELEAMMQ